MRLDDFVRFIKLSKITQNYTKLHKYYTRNFDKFGSRFEIKKEKIMPRKPEPKITFIYNSEPIMPESKRKEMYERFIMHLVQVVKEQEALASQRDLKLKK